MGHSHNDVEDRPKRKKANALNIRLTESAVFLPNDSFAPVRRRPRHPESRTATLRGLLVLDLVKPTKICSIDIELVATTSTAWPEGIGARRIDVTEDHRVFYASTIFFNGSSNPSRRTASIGPGVSYSKFSRYPRADDDFGDEADDLGWEDHRRQPRLEQQQAVRSSAFVRRNGIADQPDTEAAHSNDSFTEYLNPSQTNTTSGSTTRSRYNSSNPSLIPNVASRRYSIDANHHRPRPLYETRQEFHGDFDNRTRSELENAAPIPPYSPFPILSPEPVSAALSSPVGPAQSLEEFRNSLQSNLRHSQVLRSESSLPLASSSTLSPSLQPLDRALSAHSTTTSTATGDAISEGLEHDSEISPHPLNGSRHRSTSPTTPERRVPHSLSTLPPIQPGNIETTSHEPQHPSPTSTGADRERGRGRFSFTKIFHRSGSLKTSRIGLSRERVQEAPNPSRRDPSVDAEPSVRRSIGRGRPTERDGPRSSTLHDMEEEDDRPHRSIERGRGVIGRILKENLMDGGKDHDQWKEFKAGTYSYPVCFNIPADAPPTMQCDFGSVVWRLKANVHRPGKFKSKLTAMRDVIVIACPTEEDTEDTENILVERQWEQQLQYLISISGRSFYIGGTIPVSITMMPLTKMKVHRLSVYIEERVDYYTNMRRIARSDPVTRTCLLSLKGEGKGCDPILPLDSDSPDALRQSPIFSILDPNLSDVELSEMASNFMGPGPWSLHQDLQLPKSCDDLRFTNRNRRSNIAVSHTLKVVMRVNRGDDVHVDPKTGKRKLFDIVVQTPVLVLSCRCNPEWTSLPRYAEAFDDSAPIVPSCPCQVERSRHENPGFLERITSRHSSDSSGASAAETTVVHPRSSMSLRQGSYTNSILQSNSLFQRLVSGQESVSGECPPAYDCVAMGSPTTTTSSLTSSHGTGVVVN